MAKKFSQLSAGMSAQAQAQAGKMAEAMLAEMPLNEFREARELSQQVLGEILQMSLPAIAQLEYRTDLYLSTLRRQIEAKGGRLEVVAHFPEGAVKISHFADLEAQERP